MKRERPPLEELEFHCDPATHDATWEHGSMDIVVTYYGDHFAFMVVRDGVFRADVIYGDARCVFPMRYSMMAIHRQAIIEGCTALILRECPSVLCKQKCPPVKTLLQG